MRTLALIAQKGGTGKTTIALALSVAAARAKLKALVIDLDPQATACNWSDRRQTDSPIVIDAQPSRLSAALQKAEQNGIDLVIIDTPARSEQSALAAAGVADLIIIPCRPKPTILRRSPPPTNCSLLPVTNRLLSFSTPCHHKATARSRPARRSTKWECTFARIRSARALLSETRARSARRRKNTIRPAKPPRKSGKSTSIFIGF